MKQFKSITVSAPGKLMLLGEHAVVYDRPCLVTAVDQRMSTNVHLLKDQVLKLDAPEVKVSNYQKSLKSLGQDDIPKGAKFVEIAVKNFLKKYPQKEGLQVQTKSQFSSLFGFGSSSASTVCTIKALSELFNFKLSSKEIFDLSYKTILDIQAKGSGFDIAAAVFGGTLYFVTGGKKIVPLDADGLNLIVGYSGVKADTVTMVNIVKEKMAVHKETIDNIFDSIQNLVEDAKIAITQKDWPRLGTLMNNNQDYLENLGVSTPKLNTMISAAKDAGAYGAKLSGAGGGDCMITLVSSQDQKKVAGAITKAGGQVIKIQTNTQGVKIES